VSLIQRFDVVFVSRRLEHASGLDPKLDRFDNCDTNKHLHKIALLDIATRRNQKD
jgi:hypothetical protein